MRLGVGELFRKAREIENEEQRIDFMRKHFSPPVGKMIEYALEPEYDWDLPPGRPPFNKNGFVDQHSNLYSEIRRLYIFMKDTGKHVPRLKKETNFIQLLENVDGDDAEFLLHAKEKSLPFGFTADEIRKIYPGLIYDDTTETTPDLSIMTDEQLGKEPPKKRGAGRPPGSKNKPKAAAKSGSQKVGVKKSTKPVAQKTKVG